MDVTAGVVFDIIHLYFMLIVSAATYIQVM